MGPRPRPFVLFLVAVCAVLALLRPAGESTHFASAQAGDPEVWFGPYPAGFSNGGLNPGSGAVDYMALFQDDAPWLQARDRVDVFQFYFAWLMAAPPADIATAVGFLEAHDITIAVEASPLRIQNTALGDPKTCGLGAESWTEDPVGWTLQVLQAVEEAGGTVQYVTLQEPYTAAAPGSSPPHLSCNWTPAEVAQHVAVYIQEVRAEFPLVQFGDVEADHASPAEVAAFADAYLQAVGQPLAYMHWDLDWTFRSDWTARALEAENLMRARGIPFGMIYNGIETDTSNAQWMGHALEHVARYEGEAGGSPDHVKFQTWHAYPKQLLPESDPNAMTSLINRYFEPRTEVSLAAGPQSGDGRSATVSVSRGGDPLPNQPFEVRYSLRDGPGAEATYVIEGIVPEFPDGQFGRAVVGFTVNQACYCGFSDSFFSFFQGSLKQAATQAGLADATELIPNDHFQVGLGTNDSDTWTLNSLQPATRYVGPTEFEAAHLRNDSPTIEPGMAHSNWTPGAGPNRIKEGNWFRATLRSSVDPRSIGSGYFAVFFVSHDFLQEVKRVRVAIEPAVVAVQGVTGANGQATVQLPALPPGRLTLSAFVPGTAATLPGFSPLVQADALVPDATSVTTMSGGTSVAAGAPAQTVKVLGRAFNFDSTVTINGNPRQTTVISGTELRVALLAEDLASAGSPSFTVSTPAPGGGSDELVLPFVVPRTVTLAGAPAAAEGSPYTLNLAASYPGSNTIASWEIDWGDGAVETVDGNPSSVQHSYADGPGDATISATATDADGAWPASNTVSITVNDVSPAIELAGETSVAEAAPYQLTWSATDAGDDTITGWTVDWGDGSAPENYDGAVTGASHTYADGPASPTIGVAAQDEDGTHGPEMKSITVTNVAPEAVISGPAAITAGETYTLDLAVTDPGVEVPQEWQIDWGDGQSSTLPGSAAQATHTYTSAPAFPTITATFSDEDGTVDANEVEVTVSNVPPEITISGDATVDEGASYTLNLASSAPIIASWTIDWGDGQQSELGGSETNASHTYADDGPYTIGASATDGLDTWPAAAIEVTVLDTPPSISVEGPGSVDEGGQATITFSATDAGDDPITGWSIDWGDGTAPESVAGGATLASHVYADGPATHQAVVSAINTDGSFPADAVSISVAEVLPTVSASGASSAGEGTPYTLTLSASDPGDDPITWSIDWGDGTTSLIDHNATSANHTFADGPASWTIVATAVQGGDDYPATGVPVSVADVAPELTFTAPASIREQNPVAISFGASDPGDDEVTGWTIDWGDGGETDSLEPDATGAQHVYPTGGVQRTVTLTAETDDGPFQASKQVQVLVGPTLTISGAASVAEDELYALTLASSEAGVLTTWLIDWGDGVTSIAPGDATQVHHTYTAGPAARTIKVTGSDGFGGWQTNDLVVNVEAVPGTVEAGAPASAFTGDPVQVTFGYDEGSSSAGGPSEWRIDWGDGTEEDTLPANSDSASHTYTTPGAFTITVTAMVGTTAVTDELEIDVEAAPPPSTPGASVRFSGDDTLNVPNDASLQLTGDATFELWLRPESFATRQNPLGKAYSGEGMITQETTGRLTFFQGPRGGNVSDYDFLRTSALALNQWSHVVLVRSGSTLTWYVNGVLNATKTATMPPSASPRPLLIGNGYAGGYVGGIDEVAVYGRALSPSEVAAHFAAIADSAAYRTLVSSHGPVSYWRLDEEQGPTGLDFTTLNDGTYQGTPQFQQPGAPLDPSAPPPPSTPGASVRFSGDDTLNVPNDASLQLTGDATFELWLRPESFATRQNPLGKAYSGEGMITQETTGRLTFFQGPRGGNVSDYDFLRTSALALNQWSHVVLVRSGSTLTWYVNGVLNATKTATMPPSASPRPLLIGNGYAGGYAGGIDEVAVYGRALSPSEVAAHFAAIADSAAYRTLVSSHGPVSYWRLDEEQGPTGLDFTTLNDGTYQGTPQFQQPGAPLDPSAPPPPSTPGASVRFSGDDTLNVPNDASLQLTGDATFELWLRPESFATRQNPLGKAYSGEGMITQETTGRLTFFQGPRGGNVSDYDFLRTSALALNQWSHVVLVRSGSTLTWYVNGVLNATKTATMPPSASPRPLLIGNGYAGGYAGGIDEVAVYGRALSPSEVAAHFAAIADSAAYRTLVSSHGPVSYWRLDEEQGPTGLDFSTLNDGTYQGTPQFQQPGAP